MYELQFLHFATLSLLLKCVVSNTRIGKEERRRERTVPKSTDSVQPLMNTLHSNEGYKLREGYRFSSSPFLFAIPFDWIRGGDVMHVQGRENEFTLCMLKTVELNSYSRAVGLRGSFSFR